MNDISKEETYYYYKQFIKEPKSINELTISEMNDEIREAYRNNNNLIYQLHELELNLLFDLWENNEPCEIEFPKEVLRIPYFIDVEGNTAYLKPKAYEILDDIFINTSYDDIHRNHYLKFCLSGLTYCFIITSKDHLQRTLMYHFEDVNEERFNFLLELLLESKEIILEEQDDDTFVIQKKLTNFAPLLLLNNHLDDQKIIIYEPDYLYDFGVYGFPVNHSNFLQLVLYLTHTLNGNNAIITTLLSHLLNGAHLYIDKEDMLNKFLNTHDVDLDYEELYQKISVVVDELPCGLMGGGKYKSIELNQESEKHYLSAYDTQHFSPLLSNLVVYSNNLLNLFSTEELITNNTKVHCELIKHLIDQPNLIDDYVENLKFITQERYDDFMTMKKATYGSYNILDITDDYVVVVGLDQKIYGCKIMHDLLDSRLEQEYKFLQLAIIPFHDQYVGVLLDDQVDDEIINQLKEIEKTSNIDDMITHVSNILA